MVLRNCVAVLAAALAGCGSLEVECTTIGCSSSLEVQLDGILPAGARVELSSPGSAAAYTYECPTGAACGSTVRFPDFTPDFVNVRIIVGADTSLAEGLQPEYTEYRPNGPNCPPLCSLGRVTAMLPS